MQVLLNIGNMSIAVRTRLCIIIAFDRRLRLILQGRRHMHIKAHGVASNVVGSGCDRHHGLQQHNMLLQVLLRQSSRVCSGDWILSVSHGSRAHTHTKRNNTGKLELRTVLT
jgi:hypothetical protein